jgi:hypothetical protein
MAGYRSSIVSANHERLGVHRVRLDGSDDRVIVPGAYLLPETAPRESLALFLTSGLDDKGRTLKVVAVETGAIVPFEIKVSWPPSASSQVNFGRARWTPDGKRILFIGADAEGRAGVYVQDFVPGQDTSASRRAVTGFAPDVDTESLGLSPDGRTLVVATLHEFESLTLAEGLTGLLPPGR